MNCRDAEVMLERRIEGELTSEELETLSAHLAGCSSCAQAAQEMAAEQRMVERFRAALHSRPPIWPAVQATIRAGEPPEPRVAWKWRKTIWIGAPALAASLLLVVLSRPGRPGVSVDTSPQTAILDAQDRYLRAIDTVRNDASVNLARLPAGTAEALAKGLRELDATIAAAREAWRANPDDPLATRYLLSAYARKLELLMRYATAS